MTQADKEANTVGFGVIGARSYVANAAVLPAIERSSNARLAATASSGGPVPDRWSSTSVNTYDDVLTHPDVDAVYIPLPNGLHLEWTEKAAEAGKHVLCEKPLAADADTARRMADACSQAGVILAEAYMTPFHRRYEHMLNMIHDGRLGAIEKVDARFTFTIAQEAADNYRWDPGQGGGALLDVGIYCLGPIVELLGNAPTTIAGGSTITAEGVDAATHAVLTYGDSSHGMIECSFVAAEQQFLAVHGSTGRLVLDNQAFTGGDNDDALIVDGDRRSVESNNPYLRMVEAFADAVLGRREWRRPPERSIEMLELIDRIREATR